MYKIRKIKFKNHPILGNLFLDFCNQDGKAVDTVIIAGENGTGKSTIIDFLYHSLLQPKYEYDLELEIDNAVCTLHYYKRVIPGHTFMWVRDDHNFSASPSSADFQYKYPIHFVFSDVDINFRAKSIQNVTSMSLDATTNSRRSEGDFPTHIKQLLIDVQALDDADTSQKVRENPHIPYSQLKVDERMPRFTRAFSKMFDTLSYSHIDNRDGQKVILFKKYGIEVPIDSLSSGEKQVVYRGCFLLKDVNAINGAIVLIDEPEISLHPSWQMKIMDYYKGIFTNSEGTQTSQIFAVTHSPFIIHNDSRKNDKVIVLSRDANGSIVVKDKPEYYRCNSIEAVEDAFSIRGFSVKPTVYLEGQTDEQYFNKALKIYACNVPFEFKCVGGANEKGAKNAGASALNKAAQFLIAQKWPIKTVFLYDCDTQREETVNGKIYTKRMPQYNNAKEMKRGVENALRLDSIEVPQDCYTNIEIPNEYGPPGQKSEFNKQKFCSYVCSLDNTTLKDVFSNLKDMIEKLIPIFQEE